jgi:hypothetical protein
LGLAIWLCDKDKLRRGWKQIEEYGKIIDIISIFSCCDCNHTVVERGTTGVKEIDHLFFNFFHMLMSVYACRFLVVDVGVASRL